MKKTRESFIVLAVILTFLFVCIYISIKIEGTGGTGDSTMHYLFSRWAFKHPANFLDHWGKPLFTVFSAPFAYWGFSGMKIFNSLVASLILLFTYLTAKNFKIKHAWLVLVFLVFSPKFFTLIFSGLTEHFFALVFILGVFFISKKQYLSASMVISFLPFARSEGLIILGVFMVYFIIRKKYPSVLALLTGHVLYGLIGLFFYHHDFFWIFTKIPYAHLSDVYGSGDLFHFFRRLNYVIGPAVYTLLILGVLYKICSFFVKRFRHDFYPELLLPVYGSFGAFFLAHSLFWYLGIFNSMGLQRVLIDIIPAMAIIALLGYNFMLNMVKSFTSKAPAISPVLGVAVVLFVIYVPLSGNPYAINFKKDFSLDEEQILVHEVAEYVTKKFPDYKYFYQSSYLSIAMDVDHFDTEKRLDIRMSKFPVTYEDKSLVIWESYYSLFDGFTRERLEAWPHLEKMKTFSMRNNPKRQYIVFKYLPEVGINEVIELND